MNEGRAELQRVILQYEKQRAEAIRSKQECEIVLPFMRAALEELDAALGQSENGEVMERVQSQVRSGKARSQQVQAENVVQAAPAAPVMTSPEPTPEPQRPSFSVMDNTVAEEDEAAEESQVEAEVEASADDNDSDEHEEAKPAFPSFNRASIASLIDEAGKQEKAR